VTEVPSLGGTKGISTNSLDIYTIFTATAFEESGLAFSLQQGRVE